MGFGLATAQAERVVAGGKDDRRRARADRGGAAGAGGSMRTPPPDPTRSPSGSRACLELHGGDDERCYCKGRAARAALQPSRQWFRTAIMQLIGGTVTELISAIASLLWPLLVAGGSQIKV
jgi:hypothetical protein